MKKNTAILAFVITGFSLLLGSAGASGAYIANNLGIKHSADLSMGTSITAGSTNDSIDFTMNLIVDGSQPNREFKVGLIPLPVGLTASGYTVESDDCADINPGAGNLIVDSDTNGNFVYRFKPTGTGVCESIVTAHYKTNGVAVGTYDVSYTLTDSTDGVFGNGNDSATTSNNVQLTVQNKLTISNAKSFDSNANGYLNGYQVTFNNPLPATLLTPGQIAVTTNTKTATGIAFTGTAGSYTGTITFSDGLFDTGETPKIEITGDANYDTGVYFVGVVEDRAGPGIFVTPAAGSYTGSQNVVASLSESGTLRYSTGGVATWASPVYSGAIAISTNTTLSLFGRDMAGNTSTVSKAYSFVCAASAPANGAISAYPGCAISCNSGYNLDGGACVAIPPSSGGGGGGGGGGGASISRDWCPSGDTSGNYYDGKCVAPATGTGTTTGTGSTGTGTTTPPDTTTTPDSEISIPWITPAGMSAVEGLDSTTLTSIYFRNISEARAYVYPKLRNASTRKLADTYFKSLNFADSNYFLSLDKTFFDAYNRSVNAYVVYLLQQDAVASGDTSAIAKSRAKASLAIVKAGAKLAKNVDLRYVTRTYRENEELFVYRTMVKASQKAMLKLENKTIPKLFKLQRTGTIGITEYLVATKAYNSYVLHFTIASLHPENAEAKKRVAAAYATFMKTYNKRVKYGAVTTPSTPVVNPPTAKTVGDYYSFTKVLRDGDQNDEVMKLQQVLQHYGYFGSLAPTGYYGSITKSYLIQFSKEVLKISNPTGTFDERTRLALLKLEWK